MFNLIETIKQRRSIRKYSPTRVPRKILNEILEAAQSAPSPHNVQPCRFIILTQKNSKKNLAVAMAQTRTEDLIRDNVPLELIKRITKASVQRFTNAPVLIIACITIAEMTKYPDEQRQKNERDLTIQSLGAATENMLLAAHSKDLGACWFCAPIFCKDAVRRVLRVPEDIEPQALIAMGYPAEKPSTPVRKPFQDIFYFDYWDKKPES
jgi:coenzyme F420-0:L-glutamate ligase/coenzyme F420-1:gamma-L-glutamate ligase